MHGWFWHLKSIPALKELKMENGLYYGWLKNLTGFPGSWKIMANHGKWKTEIQVWKSHGKWKFGKKSCKSHGIFNFNKCLSHFFWENVLITYNFDTQWHCQSPIAVNILHAKSKKPDSTIPGSGLDRTVVVEAVQSVLNVYFYFHLQSHGILKK